MLHSLSWASASWWELGEDEQCQGGRLPLGVPPGTVRFVLSIVDMSCWGICACLTKLMFITEERAMVPGDQLVPSGLGFCWSWKQCSPLHVLGFWCRAAVMTVRWQVVTAGVLVLEMAVRTEKLGPGSRGWGCACLMLC